MGRTDTTRRNVLAGALASATVAALPVSFSAAAAADPPRKRRNIESLSADEVRTYEHAIKILMDRSAANPDDRTGYQHWAALHDLFDVSIHSGCTHSSEKFLPWHRRLLHDFELALQQTDPPATANVMIPYWDWSLPPRVGAHFPSAFENRASPLYVRRNAASPPPWDPADLRSLVREQDWTLFAGKADPSDLFGGNPGAVESGPHNTLHGNISRFMANPTTAVQDPIFWSFHAGIDLTWARWQRLHVSPARPQPFMDPAAVIWFQDRSYSVGSTASTADLGYEYEYDSSADAQAAQLRGLAAPTPVPSVNTSPRRVIRLNARGGTAGLAGLAAPATPSAGASVLLRLADVRVFQDRTYRLQLYLHPGNVALSRLGPAAKRRYLVRTMTLWRAHHDYRVEMFVRPSPEQVASLRAGWTVTVESEDVATDEAPPPHAGHPSSLAPPRLATSRIADLFGAVELQER